MPVRAPYASTTAVAGGTRAGQRRRIAPAAARSILDQVRMADIQAFVASRAFGIAGWYGSHRHHF